MFADFAFGEPTPEPAPTGLRISALLPDPIGNDRGHEQVTLPYATSTAVNVSGWVLRDRAQNEFQLNGSIAANSTISITMANFSVPLNNSGDEVFLLDPQSVVRHQVRYEASQVQAGVVISFVQ